jgi:hypothetical protein
MGPDRRLVQLRRGLEKAAIAALHALSGLYGHETCGVGSDVCANERCHFRDHRLFSNRKQVQGLLPKQIRLLKSMRMD